jgi:multidrug resistance efflux pump
MDTQNSRATPQSSQEALPVIPTPRGTLWREFRVRYLPILIFSATIVGIWQLWQSLPAGGIRGIGDGAVSLITSPQDGFLQSEAVEPYGLVEAGQPLVSITPFDPTSSLNLFQSRLQVARLGLEPSLPQRSAIDYERLRVDSLRLKQELAMAKANLDLATKVLPRHEALLKERLISQDVHDATVRDRDLYRAEVEEKSKAIQEIDKRLEVLRAMSDPGSPNTSATSHILPELEEELVALQTNWSSVLIQAPIRGEVQFFRRAGEFVRAGDPILVINAPRATRVIAYLKQPFSFEPGVGMPMEVITRTRNPKRFLTKISHVGARVEVLTNAIAYVPAGALVDSGLPLVLPVPPEAEIWPGEIVDVLPRSSYSGRSLISRLFGTTPQPQ